jgi:hypothetical protein
VPPAPEGLLWWKYAPGVPPLPTVASVLGASFSSYQWRYDPDYKPNSFEFTNLDKVGAHCGSEWTAVIDDCIANWHSMLMTCHALTQASMANIPPKSGLVAVHMISGWVMTLWVLWVRSLPHAACCSGTLIASHRKP